MIELSRARRSRSEGRNRYFRKLRKRGNFEELGKVKGEGREGAWGSFENSAQIVVHLSRAESFDTRYAAGSFHHCFCEL